MGVPAGCSSATGDHGSSASAEIETWRELCCVPDLPPGTCSTAAFAFGVAATAGGLAARGNARLAMLRQDGSIQQTADSLVELTVAHCHLCRAGSSLARIALRALRTRRSQWAIW